MTSRLTHPTRRAVLGSLAAAAALPATSARAQAKTVRIAKQFGVSYLPLTIMDQEKLFEAHAKKLGIEIAAEWLQFTNGSPINDALLSGSLEIAGGGIGPMILIWGKTRASLGVKAIATLNSMPLYLVTKNPNVKTIADFTEKDKIALPAIKISVQALTLQMAAEQLFGAGQHAKLDPFTISMGHPDAQTALLSGRSEITAHFGSAPFMYEELKDPRCRKVLDSYDVLGGPHTFNVMWTTSKYASSNPLVIKAFTTALAEALDIIIKEPARAAKIFVAAEKSKIPAEELARLLALPENVWTMTPMKMTKYAEFMHAKGLLAAKPTDWKDMFFDVVHHLPGS